MATSTSTSVTIVNWDFLQRQLNELSDAVRDLGDSNQKASLRQQKGEVLLLCATLNDSFERVKPKREVRKLIKKPYLEQYVSSDDPFNAKKIQASAPVSNYQPLPATDEWPSLANTGAIPKTKKKSVARVWKPKPGEFNPDEFFDLGLNFKSEVVPQAEVVSQVEVVPQVETVLQEAEAPIPNKEEEEYEEFIKVMT